MQSLVQAITRSFWKNKKDFADYPLIGENADGSPLNVDARSSDAISLVVRFGCPIFTTEEIMQEAGIVLDSPSKAFTNKKGSLSEYSLEELQQLLEQVLAKEDYESASRIRDAIERKKM